MCVLKNCSGCTGCAGGGREREIGEMMCSLDICTLLETRGKLETKDTRKVTKRKQKKNLTKC